MVLAHINENSARYAEAFYYYYKVVGFDSTQTEVDKF